MLARFIKDNSERFNPADYQLGDGYSSLVITPRFRASSHVIFMLIPNGTTEPTLVAKVPRLKEARGSLTLEAEALCAIQDLHSEKLTSIPQLIAFEDYCDYPLLIETALNGILMDNAYIRSHFAECCTLVTDWLLALQPKNRPAPRTNWFESLVQEPLAYLSSKLSLNSEESDLLEKTRQLIEPLASMNLPFVIEHGDLSHPNLIVDPNGELGVVDWELATTEGLPGCDLFFFLAYGAFARQRASTNPEYIAAFHQAFFEPTSWARPYVRSYLHDLGVTSEALKPLFILCWARYTIQLLRRLERSEQSEDAMQTAVEWLRTNRFFALWRYAVSHADRLESVW